MRLSIWRLTLGTAIAMFPMQAISEMVVDSTSGCHVFVDYPQPGEVTHWSGSCVSGFAEGEGRLVSSNGTDLTGEFKDGKPFNATGRSFLVLNIGIKKVVGTTFKDGLGYSYPAKRTAEDAAAYSAALRSKIVPLIAPATPIEGNPVVIVQLTLSFRGDVLNVKVVQPSGQVEWDEAVLRAVREAKNVPVSPFGDYIVQASFRPKSE